MTMAMTIRTIIMMMTIAAHSVATMTMIMATTTMVVLMSFYETIVLGVRQSLIFLC